MAIAPFVLCFLCAVASTAFAMHAKPVDAAAVSCTYYRGTAVLTNLLNGSETTQDVIMMRTVDPGNSMLRELACVLSGGRAMVSPVYFGVSGKNLLIADGPYVTKPQYLTGTGTVVVGDPFKWTSYLTFDMVYLSAKIRVLDANFFVPSSGRGIARKQLFLPDGTPFQLYDVTLDVVSSAAFGGLWTQFGCPGQVRNCSALL